MRCFFLSVFFSFFLSFFPPYIYQPFSFLSLLIYTPTAYVEFYNSYFNFVPRLAFLSSDLTPKSFLARTFLFRKKEKLREMTAIIEFPRFVRRRPKDGRRGVTSRQSISVSFERYGRGGVERASTRVERGVCVCVCVWPAVWWIEGRSRGRGRGTGRGDRGREKRRNRHGTLNYTLNGKCTLALHPVARRLSHVPPPTPYITSARRINRPLPYTCLLSARRIISISARTYLRTSERENERSWLGPCEIIGASSRWFEE